MKIDEVSQDVLLINLDVYEDSRGFFLESYNKMSLKKHNINIDFLQDNTSFSKNKNTIRGLHFQREPFSQSKLISVLKGSIFDVFIDVRRDSDNFGIYKSIILDHPGKALLIPKGFIHGFCTLEDNTIVNYKVDNEYNINSETGVIWNDCSLDISWPLDGDLPTVSKKDENLLSWNSFKDDLKKNG